MSTGVMLESDPKVEPIDRVEYTQPPDWAIYKDGPRELARKVGEPVTRLLLDIQHDTDSRSSYVKIQQRLENKQAVQELSQWRINFDPNSQRILLHSIRIIRDNDIREYASPDKIRIIQREEDLESFILHGAVTLLAVFENIRVGDIIETCYTQINTPQLLPDHFSSFSSPPEGGQTGHYHYSVRFPKEKAIQWKSEAPGNEPVEHNESTHTRWSWEGTNLSPEDPEANTPGWVLADKWVHLSDMSSWTNLANAAFEAWPRETELALPDEIESKIEALDQNDKVESIIRFIQDEFRYLSIKTDLGGQIPNPPSLVLERRYGDCKDLSSLLTHLLHEIGIRARPILVNQHLSKALPKLLPSATAFNHVIVEFEMDGKSYWVDPTFSEQGGGPKGRYVPPYEYGLPIQEGPAELIRQPSSRSVKDSYRQHETIMLDTAKNGSILRISIEVSGKYADGFRKELSQQGTDGFIREAEDHHQDRYKTEQALEPAKFNDDRDLNIWRMIELYEIDFYKSMQYDNKFIQVQFPQTIVATAVTAPEDKARRSPFAIHDMLDVTHVIEVRSKTNRSQRTEVNNFNHEGFRAKVECVYKREIWTHTSTLTTSTDHIPADKTIEFRKLLEDLWNSSHWVITAPRGQVRPHRPKDFDSLPNERKAAQVSATPPPLKETSKLQLKPQRIAAHPQEAEKQEKENRDRRRRKRTAQKSSPDNQGSLAKFFSIFKS